MIKLFHMINYPQVNSDLKTVMVDMAGSREI